jgi:hypothetical protein
MAGGLKQPAAKLSAIRVVLEFRHRLGGHAHDILRHVRRVRFLEPVSRAMAKDQRRVEPYEFAPSLRIFHSAQAQQ